MQKIWKKWNRIWFGVCFLALSLQMTVWAAPPLGSIRVLLVEDADRQPIEGSSVYMHKVAWADEYFDLYYEDAYEDLSITAHELFHEDRIENAQIVYQYIQKRSIQGQEKHTDAEGAVLFEGLGEGAYLIHAKSSGGTWFEPFLIFVPMEIDAVDHYQIQATPKTSYRPPIDPGEQPGEDSDEDDDSTEVEISGMETPARQEGAIIPQTGENMLLVYGLIGVGVLLVLLGIVDMTGKGEGHE